MCTNKHYIINHYTGQRLLVRCGRCEACRQEKALNRSNRIKNSIGTDEIAIFFTLTYRNENIPYVRRADLLSLSPDEFGNFHLPVYRDLNLRRLKHGGYKKISMSEPIGEVLASDYVSLDSYMSDVWDLPSLTHDSDDRTSICWYPDVKNFFKRLRINLQRNYHYDRPFKYFCCTEYGTATKRAHIHGLVISDKDAYSTFKRAIVETWPFADSDRTATNVEVAINAAAYVSSYVNSSVSVPALFKHIIEAQPVHHYSKGFGISSKPFSLSEILKAYYRRDFHYDCETFRNGCFIRTSRLVPVYVMRRYFPKIKGLCNLTFNEAFAIYSRPTTLLSYKRRLGYQVGECEQVITMLRNKHKLFAKYGVSPDEFARISLDSYNIYKSQTFRDSFDDLVFIHQNFYAYDNIIDYFTGQVLSPSLDGIMSQVPKAIIADPNFFPDNIKRDRQLREIYQKCDKTKRVRHEIFKRFNMSNLNYNF